MDLALYDSDLGYYARAAQRSGRAGDFFTSVDVGAAVRRAARTYRSPRWRSCFRGRHSESAEPFDLVEAGAGNGRLSADILNAARQRAPGALRTHASPSRRSERRRTRRPARDARPGGGQTGDLLTGSAFVVRRRGLRQRIARRACRCIRSSCARTACAKSTLTSRPANAPGGRSQAGSARRARRICERECPARNRGVPAQHERRTTIDAGAAAYLARLNVSLEPGWRVEINLRALDWIRDIARRLRRGFIILIDYGHEARELYSVSHAAGTLTTYSPGIGRPVRNRRPALRGCTPQARRT